MKSTTITRVTITKNIEFTAEEIEKILLREVEADISDATKLSVDYDVSSGGLLRGATVTITKATVD